MVLTEKYGDVTIISLNRPKHRNAITRQMASKISEAISAFENDQTASVGVLHGTGGNFSAGHDLNDLVLEVKNPEKFLKTEGCVVNIF